MSISAFEAAQLPERRSPYGYVPSRPVAFIFLALFSISTAIHTAQAVKYRKHFMLGTAMLCGIIELIGWFGRLWSSFEVLNGTPFQIQITCTIIAPTPLLAATFVIFGRMISRLGAVYSRLSAKLYTRIFLTCDIISLVVQGAGGGIAASARDLEGANKGANIMLGGIVFQLVVIVVFSLLAGEFFFRYFRNIPIPSRVESVIDDTAAHHEHSGRVPPRGKFTLRLRMMSGALAFSTLVLFIRSIYRTVELTEGWSGPIIQTEVYFNVLDGMMVIFAIYTLNFFHPGLLLDEVRATGWEMLDRKQRSNGNSSLSLV